MLFLWGEKGERKEGKCCTWFVLRPTHKRERERERDEKCFTEESKGGRARLLRAHAHAMSKFVFLCPLFLLFGIKATHKGSTLTHNLFWHTTALTYA